MTLKRWDGAAYQTLTTLKRWNGSAWVSLTIGKRWNGTAWIDILGGGGGGLVANVSPATVEGSEECSES